MENGVKHRLSEHEKIRLVDEYFQSGKSKAAFASEKNIDRKSLARWIKKIESKPRAHTLNIKTSNEMSDTEAVFSISCVEYFELLKIKRKYEAINSVLDI